MTFLELCKRLRQEAGISGVGPTAVTGQTGEYAKVVDWIKRANRDLQNMDVSWDFMWAQYSLQTTESSPGDFLRDYTLSNVSAIDKDSVQCYLTADQTNYWRMTKLEYPAWRYRYNMPASQLTAQKPTMYTVLPDGTFRLEPKPDADYTITFDYYRTPVELVNGTDVPIIPEPFHLVIVYKALLDYGRFENATEQYSAAQVEYAQLLDEFKAKHIRDAVIWHRPLV